MHAQHEVRCPECRGGQVCAAAWEIWFARCDEAEASWVRAGGSPEGFWASSEGAGLADERPACEPDADCPACGGTGILHPATITWSAA